MITSIVFDVLLFGILGFGVWRGQALWGRHIELKHEREVAHLAMKRMAKSVELEIAQNRALADLELLQRRPKLASPEGTISRKSDTYVCVCGARSVAHIHAYRDGKSQILLLPVALLDKARLGDFSGWEIRGTPLGEWAMEPARVLEEPTEIVLTDGGVL